MDKLTPIKVLNKLTQRKLAIFSIQDFARIVNTSPKSAKAFLSRHTRSGNFARIKQGLYIATANEPAKFEIANNLVRPSYISFETALSYHKIIPETVYSITSATTQRSQSFGIREQSYQFYRIKKTLYFGYTPIKLRGSVILMATPEKALLDYVYLVSLKKKDTVERIDLKKVDTDKLGKFVGVMKRRLRK
ncbi:MAG: hypothetical protein HY422_00060, partial [Candidatus Komeilibacteria bacterium]|nr:hypothetical protein [Candidatus Komeilibacteria bacterium]